MNSLAAQVAADLRNNGIEYVPKHDVDAGLFAFEIVDAGGAPRLLGSIYFDEADGFRFGARPLDEGAVLAGDEPAAVFLRYASEVFYWAVSAAHFRVATPPDADPEHVSKLMIPLIAQRKREYQKAMQREGESQVASGAETPKARARRLGIRDLVRLERWKTIEEEYVPEGITQADMAERSGVAVETIRGDIAKMKRHPKDFPKTAMTYSSKTPR